MKAIEWNRLEIGEVAGAVCEHLNKRGLEAVLVGGACVSIYSENQYQSFDLDFISYEPTKRIEEALKELGFVSTSGRHYDHPDCKFFVEFIAPPVAIGKEPIRKFGRHKTTLGTVKLLTPTDCVKDRLAAFIYWKDHQAFEQARLVASGNQIDWVQLEKWGGKEDGGIAAVRSLRAVCGK